MILMSGLSGALNQMLRGRFVAQLSHDSLALPDPLRPGAYRLEIISLATRD